DGRGLIASDGKLGVGLLPVVWLAHLTTVLPPCLTGGHPRARRPVLTRERNRPASSTGATEADRGPQAGPPRRPAPVPLEYSVGGLTCGSAAAVAFGLGPPRGALHPRLRDRPIRARPTVRAAPP